MTSLQVWLERSEATLVVSRLTTEAALSGLFEVTALLLSEDPSLPLDDIVGHRAAAMMEAGPSRSLRDGRYVWSGLCSSLELLRAEPEGMSSYRLRLRPELWRADQRRNHRLFHQKSIPEIVEQLLLEWQIDFTWRIDREAHPRLEHKIQYGESDYRFIKRLLEEAGITFFFEDTDGDDETDAEPRSGPRFQRYSRLILADHPQDADKRAAGTLPFDDAPTRVDHEHVTALQIGHEVRPGAMALRDYDFRNPNLALLATSEQGAETEQRYEVHSYAPGSFLIGVDGDGATPIADDHGAARYEPDYGNARAQRQLEALRSGNRQVRFESNALDLAPGVIGAVGGHPHALLHDERRLLLTARRIDAPATELWTQHIEAVFADQPYRPAQVTPKPQVHAVQSGTVIGPEGEEIHTDELGRVRVQFPWDREGARDEHASCWMRVSQGWAGVGYGMLNLPRIGHEVLVAFLHGDPDHPLVVGRVFNATQNVPYPLPEEKTKSTWKSDSSLGHDGFNELMFEDRKGSELVYLQAERNLRKLVKNNEFHTTTMNRIEFTGVSRTEVTGAMRVQATGVHETEIVGLNRTVLIGRTLKELVKNDQIERTEGHHQLYVDKDEDVVIHNNRRIRVDQDVHRHVRGEQRGQIDKDVSLVIGGDQHERVDGSHLRKIGQELHVEVGKKIVLEAGMDFTLKGPGGFIRIDGSGVTVVGKLVRINSGGSAGKGSGAEPQAPAEAKEAKIDPPLKPDLKKLGL